MAETWKDDVYRKRAELAGLLHEPMARLAGLCGVAWGDRQRLNDLLAAGCRSIPHVASLYVLDRNGLQISDNVGVDGVTTDRFGRDRSQRPYMSEPVPAWGFLLSDAYVSLSGRPSLTALHVVRDGETELGYFVADFDLRDLPAAGVMHQEPRQWRQIKGDPSIRGGVFQQMRVESPMDRNIVQALAILDDLITERGMFQVVIHFSSSRATGWFVDDPFRYRILDHEALADPDICLLYPPQPWPGDALMTRAQVKPVLDAMGELRLTDQNIYLRSASINIFNGMVSLTFSCDGSHYMSCEEFLDRQGDFWSAIGG
ncbi:MAG: PDC sensor domain-containing protein [Gammaproteobacteria bacterium]|nr:PDC sensor domain-containing protein [Gammaproteobacteria bacterium]MBU1647205.1 PDC sensor domain-containing protein [Gammaproteobacteria bacterium]MBU1972717.1 PDC sensor domain-containing protein [Gammaproteobacteria bacterium]